MQTSSLGDRPLTGIRSAKVSKGEHLNEVSSLVRGWLRDHTILFHLLLLSLAGYSSPQWCLLGHLCRYLLVDQPRNILPSICYHISYSCEVLCPIWCHIYIYRPLYIVKQSKPSNINMKGINVGGKRYNNLRWDDDTALLAGNEKELSEFMSKINEIAKRMEWRASHCSSARRRGRLSAGVFIAGMLAVVGCTRTLTSSSLASRRWPPVCVASLLKFACVFARPGVG